MNERKLTYDARWQGANGIGRFSAELGRRIEASGYSISMARGARPLSLISILFDFLRFSRRLSPGFNVGLFGARNTIITIHDLMHINFPAYANVLNRIYYEYCVKRCVRASPVTFTVSEFSRREIVDWAGVSAEKVVVVPNGVGARFCKAGPLFDASSPYYLYIGNSRPHKNLMRLIPAFSAAQVDSDVLLLLSCEPTATLYELISRSENPERFRFVGPIAEAELPAYYRGARALLLPSLYEGFGLPALEAMACGTPVLTTAGSALEETVGAAAVLVDALSIRSIASGIESIDASPELRARLSLLGIERAANFSWDKTADMVIDTLEHIGWLRDGSKAA